MCHIEGAHEFPKPLRNDARQLGHQKRDATIPGTSLPYVPCRVQPGPAAPPPGKTFLEVKGQPRPQIAWSQRAPTGFPRVACPMPFSRHLKIKKGSSQPHSPRQCAKGRFPANRFYRTGTQRHAQNKPSSPPGEYHGPTHFPKGS